MRSVVENKSRLYVVDALRGFALDNGVGSVVFVLFAGRVYAIFALLQRKSPKE